MPQKKGSKPLWIDGVIHATFREKLKEEGWTWGMTKKVERLMADYVMGTKEPLDQRGGVHLAGVPLPPTVGVYQEPEKPIRRKGQVGENPSKGRHTASE